MAQRTNEDLFASSTMTFGEHLEELRTCLVRAVVGLLIGFVVGLFFAKSIVQFIQTPLKSALDDYYLEKAKLDVVGDTSLVARPEMLQVVQQQALVPDSMMIEPQGVLRALQMLMPDQFDDVEYDMTIVRTSDIDHTQISQLCRQWTEQSEQESTLLGTAWSLLAAEDQQTIKDIADAVDPPDRSPRQLAGIFNKLVRDPGLFQSSAFAQLQIETDSTGVWYQPWTYLASEDIANKAYRETVEMLRADLSSSTKDQDKVRRLNRMLLAEAVPALERASIGLVSVPIWKPSDIRVQSLGAHEAFMIWLKAGFVAGLVIASPWIFIQLWLFVGAGLYPHEKRYVHVFLPISLVLFLAGVAMAFLFVFEPVLQFLFTFNRAMEIDPDPRISEWLGFVLFLPLGFGLAFQLPLVMLFINRIGLVSIEVFLSGWRIAVLAIFVVSMLLTPADPISMLLMAIPLTFLYFLGIGLCRWMPQFRNPMAELD